MISYEVVNAAFKNKPVLSRNELASYIKTDKPILKDSSFDWLCYNLCKNRVIERVAYNSYKLYSGEGKKMSYTPNLSEEAVDVLEFVKGRFPLLSFIVWETRALNEFTNHQLARNIIFVEVEKPLSETAFYALHDYCNHVVLHNPTGKELLMYAGMVTVVTLSLTSEAPMNGYFISLEKMLVDLFANKQLEQTISRGDCAGIFEEAFSRYRVNENMMFRYAKRRNKYKELSNFIRHKTTISLIGGNQK